MSAYFKYLSPEILNQPVDRIHFPFSQHLFWDAPITTIDIEHHKNFIIERVIGRGLLADFYLLLKMYTQTEIISAIKKSKTLDPKTVNFCCIYFEIPRSDLYASPFYS